MARKGERDWAHLDALEVEYMERLAAESKRSDSEFLAFLDSLSRGYNGDWVYRRIEKSKDPKTGRLYALRGKILTLREKVGLTQETLLPSESEMLGRSASTAAPMPPSIKFQRDPAPPGFLHPVTFKEIKAILAELPPEHAATVRRIHLTNQKRTGTDGDWQDGYIRLHCLYPEHGWWRVGRNESTYDAERFGGTLEWRGDQLYAHWPLDAYKTFVLRRVLIHEVAHGVAELPGYPDAVRRAGSVEKFCEQYAENFYRPPGPSVRLGF